MLAEVDRTPDGRHRALPRGCHIQAEPAHRHDPCRGHRVEPECGIHPTAHPACAM